MIKFKKQLVSQNVIDKRSYGRGNPVNSITIHQTGNTRVGANAEMHAKLQLNLNPREASWHYQVDDERVIQSFDDNIRCWHATDGRGPGNTTSLAIEICINGDGDYEKAIKNAAELVKVKMNEHNLGIEDIKQHSEWYPKNCPAQLRAAHKGISWDDFLDMVKGDIVQVSNPKPSTKPISSNPSISNLVVDGYWGPATTRALQAYFKTPIDGVTSGQYRNASTQNISSVQFGTSGSLLIKAMQRWLGVKQDGWLGPITVRALQRKLGTVQDGVISSPSLVVRELQRRLNAGKL